MTTTRELREDGSLSLREDSSVALREPEDVVSSPHVFQCDVFQGGVFQQVCGPAEEHVFQCDVFQGGVFQQVCEPSIPGITGTLVASEAADVAAFTGTVFGVVSGKLVATEGADVASFIAAVGTNTFQCNVFQGSVFQQFGCPVVEPPPIKPPTGGGDWGVGRVTRGARIRWRVLRKKLAEVEAPSEAAKEELEKLSDALDDIVYAPLPVFHIAQTTVRAVIAAKAPSASEIARLTQALYAAQRAWEEEDEEEVQFLLLD